MSNPLLEAVGLVAMWGGSGVLLLVLLAAILFLGVLLVAFIYGGVEAVREEITKKHKKGAK